MISASSAAKSYSRHHKRNVPHLRLPPPLPRLGPFFDTFQPQISTAQNTIRNDFAYILRFRHFDRRHFVLCARAVNDVSNIIFHFVYEYISKPCNFPKRFAREKINGKFSHRRYSRTNKNSTRVLPKDIDMPCRIRTNI